MKWIPPLLQLSRTLPRGCLSWDIFQLLCFHVHNSFEALAKQSMGYVCVFLFEVSMSQALRCGYINYMMVVDHQVYLLP